MSLDLETMITPCESAEASSVPGIRYNAVPLAKLTTLDKDAIIGNFKSFIN
jgi:hypothetical protein